MVFSSPDAVLASHADQLTGDPAADEGISDTYGADLLQELGANAAAAGQPQHTSMRVQARALYRKSAMYQARKLSTNICIISAPVFFCLFLLLLRAGMQQLMSGGEFKVRSADGGGSTNFSGMPLTAAWLDVPALCCGSSYCSCQHNQAYLNLTKQLKSQHVLNVSLPACSAVASALSAATRAMQTTAPACRTPPAHTPVWSAAAATVVCSSLREHKLPSVTSHTRLHGQQLYRCACCSQGVTCNLKHHSSSSALSGRLIIARHNHMHAPSGSCSDCAGLPCRDM